MQKPVDYFHRIGRLAPYVFSEVNNLKLKLRREGTDIIDLGMGNPDSPTPEHIVKKLIETCQNPNVHGYSSSRGIKGLRKASSDYYKRRFNVDICPEKEAIVTIGSKEGLASLAKATTKLGDTVLVPDPCYPIHTFGFVIVDANVVHISSTNKDNFFEKLEETFNNCSPKPVALILNYPCNPTAEVVDLEFYEQAVDFCRFHGMYIWSDLAYCEIYFNDKPPPSVLQVKGAKDIAVEFISMSKTYSMAGWRVGMAVGNETLIAALTKIKSYLDYGIYTPIQVAAAEALNASQQCVIDNRAMYKDRRDTLIGGLNRAGWKVESPDASMFCWAKIPEKFAEMGSLEFSKMLMHKSGVAVSPGIGFGKNGDKFVRIAMVENKQRIRQATKNIKLAFA